MPIIIPGKIIQVCEPDPGEDAQGRFTRNAIFLFNYSLSKVGSRYGSGFGIGNQGGNSLFSFKLNNRIKPHNNWNPLQLNNPTFNSKLYQKNGSWQFGKIDVVVNFIIPEFLEIEVIDPKIMSNNH